MPEEDIEYAETQGDCKFTLRWGFEVGRPITILVEAWAELEIGSRCKATFSSIIGWSCTP